MSVGYPESEKVLEDPVLGGPQALMGFTSRNLTKYSF